MGCQYRYVPDTRMFDNRHQYYLFPLLDHFVVADVVVIRSSGVLQRGAGHGKPVQAIWHSWVWCNSSVSLRLLVGKQFGGKHKSYDA